MAWIQVIDEASATGELKSFYEGTRARVGRVPNIVKLSSLRPEAMRSASALFQSVMYGKPALSRAQREMVAIVVSQLNGCHY